MLLNKPKTFFNCYFYALSNEKGNVVENDILEYVTNAQRINYGDVSFKNIKDQLKARSTSAVLYRILQRGDINLCIYKKELPSSFKVFCAKDKRSGSNTKKIFIDATGLIEYQDGQFYCKDIDRLATYLTGALVQMIYYTDTTKLTNNAILQKCSVSAFVKMFSGVMDYLKVNNYLQNRERILYIAGVYFGYSVMGLDIESARRISAVINRVNPMDQKAHDYRYIEDDLTNIDTFITSITNTFKLVGMNTAVFANKWLFLYGKGTIYAMELYPLFLSTIMYAYAGTYLNNWKRIETTCGKDMVDIAVNVLKIGGDIYNRGFSYESANNIPEYNNSCCNPPTGFKYRSIDDKDYQNESYDTTIELGGLLELSVNEETEPKQESEPISQAQNDQAEANNNQQGNISPQEAREQLKDKYNESVEETQNRIYAILREQDDLFNANAISKEGLKSEEEDQGVKTPGEAENLVDALEDDNPMEECGELELGDGQKNAENIIDCHDKVGEPRDSEEVQNFVDDIEEDNPMNESEDLGQGREDAAEAVDDHDKIGLPRDSEEVESLTCAIEDDVELK